LCEDNARQFEGGWFTIVTGKGGFRIEGIDMGGSSFHEQEHDSFSAWRKVRFFRGERIGRLDRGDLCGEERMQSESTESECRGLKDTSSCE
jgi:hypothetical protein